MSLTTLYSRLVMIFRNKCISLYRATQWNNPKIRIEVVLAENPGAWAYLGTLK